MTDPSSDRDLNALSGAVVDAAFTVHKTLGPRLLESVYDACLTIEFKHRGIPFSRQRDVPITYRDTPIEAPLRLDFIIAEKLVLEIKAVE